MSENDGAGHLEGAGWPDEQTVVARVTYRYLRWLMVLLPAVLFVVTMLTAIQQGKLEHSISAYYGAQYAMSLSAS